MAALCCCLRVFAVAIGGWVLVFCSGFARADQPAITAEQERFFEAKIRPVLVRECYGCHSNQTGNARGGLRLDTPALMAIGGGSGPAVVPGDPESSLLYTALRHEDFEMPPNRKLPDAVIADFRVWIEAGAPDPRQSKQVELQSTITEEEIAEARRDYWAYQPPRRPVVPDPEAANWPVTTLDHFVLARLEEHQLSPAVDATPEVLLRRLTFDLVGMPPTPEESQAFVAEYRRAPQRAIEATIDRLLDRDAFGERWGRHWLDVARYAESTGRSVNMTYPHAWRYRDWVIDAFNQDLPYNEFMRQQIAGDLLPAADEQQWADQLVATTFLAIGPKNVNEPNRVQFAADVIDEQIDVTTRVFLGASVACARCHDHKFDAFAQDDYYALAGIFRSTKTYFGNPPSQYGSAANAQTRQQSSLLRLPINDPNPYDPTYTAAELQQLRDQVADLRQRLLEARRNRQQGNGIANILRLTRELAEVNAKLAVVDEAGAPISYCMGVQDEATPRDAAILARGEIDQPGPAVPRNLPRVFVDAPLKISEGASGRLQLADWMADESNPLTARVMVNRIWQHLVGRGLVQSTENFGVTGTPPTHPELLDFLAVGFMEADWSVKRVIREIARSRVYRMASTGPAEYQTVDPENRWLWRAHRRPLSAEAVRDAMLAISGQLEGDRPRGSEVAKAGYVRVRDGVLGDPREQIREAITTMASQTRERIRQRFTGFRRGQGPDRQAIRARGREAYNQAVGEAMQQVTGRLDAVEATCRSVYLPVVRDETPHALAVFDFPDPSNIVGTREASNTANQALFMMNNAFVEAQSEAWAERLRAHYPASRTRLEAAFEMAFGRAATADERRVAGRYLLQTSRDREGLGERTPWGLLCQGLMATAEFRYLD